MQSFPSTLLTLSDHQLSIVMAAAHPLPRRAHQEFFEAVAARLSGVVEIGDGLVARTCRETQRGFFDPPQLIGKAGRYG
jgi:hypothetical protein